MAELLVAQLLWLLGQDDQLLRPRVATLRAAITAGALVDVLNSGAAGWAGTDHDTDEFRLVTQPGWEQFRSSPTLFEVVTAVDAAEAVGEPIP